MKRYVLTLSVTTFFLFALLALLGINTPALAQTKDGQVDLTLSSSSGNLTNTNQVNGSTSGLVATGTTGAHAGHLTANR